MSAYSPFSLVLSDVCVDRNGLRVLETIDLAIHAGSRVGLVGPNGVGKSTLLSTLAGDLAPVSGSVRLTPATAKLAVLSQARERSSTETTLEYLQRHLGITAAQKSLNSAIEDLANGAVGADDRYDAALAAWQLAGADTFDARLESVASDLGLTRDALGQRGDSLSGGQAAKAALAAVMLAGADCLLLDEPTNDLDAHGLAYLEEWLTGFGGGVVVVSHDRQFLANTVTSVCELDEHSRTASVFAGGWEAYLAAREARRQAQVAAYTQHETQRERLRQRAQVQREWADRGASAARRQPADKDKHRRRAAIDQTEKLVGRAAAVDKELERLGVVEKPWEGWDLRFTIADAPRGGVLTIECDAAVFRRGAFDLGPVDVHVSWGERVRIDGPNGSGKTTLIDGLLGRLPPAAGRVRLGPAVVVGELDQWRVRFDRADATTLDVFEERTGLFGSESRSVLAKFGLGPREIDRPARTLSPGERTRTQLAEFQARGVNLLVLDEPTNHLDLPAIEQLESALSGYDGTLLLVTHDRRFADAIDAARTIDIQTFQGDRF